MIDTILSMHPEIYELVARDFSGKVSRSLGRGDSPTIEQILRGALYKEMKGLTYREWNTLRRIRASALYL